MKLPAIKSTAVQDLSNVIFFFKENFWTYAQSTIQGNNLIANGMDILLTWLECVLDLFNCQIPNTPPRVFETCIYLSNYIYIHDEDDTDDDDDTDDVMLSRLLIWHCSIIRLCSALAQ